MSGDELTRRRVGRVIEMRVANTGARTTDAVMFLRKAIVVLEPLERTERRDRIAELLDEAATLLLAEGES